MAMAILGLDCGDAQALAWALQRHADLFARADLICAPQRLLDKLPAPHGAKLEPLRLPIRPWLASLGALCQNGGEILLLADGDPLFFGLASTLAEMGASWPIKIFPAVSCMQRACAKIGLPWAGLPAFSLHGRDDFAPLLPVLAAGKSFCLLGGASPGPSAAARLMLDRGCLDYEIRSFQNLGSPGERLGAHSLEECAALSFPPDTVCLFLAIPPKPQSSQAAFGAYSTPPLRRGMILELMGIAPGDTVWDLGAGSGLLGAEMAARAHEGRVWAIEERSGRALDIQRNRAILGTPNLELAFGRAPEILAGLPDPDKIFIGGALSGPEHGAILSACAERLAPGGRIIACCVLLESLRHCLDHPWGGEFEAEFWQTQIAKGAPLGKGHALAPEKACFLIKIQKRAQ